MPYIDTYDGLEYLYPKESLLKFIDENYAYMTFTYTLSSNIQYKIDTRLPILKNKITELFDNELNLISDTTLHITSYSFSKFN